MALTDFAKPVTKDGLRDLRVELTILDASRAVSMHLVEGKIYRTRQAGSNVLWNRVLMGRRGHRAKIFDGVHTFMHPHLVVRPTADDREVWLSLTNT